MEVKAKIECNSSKVYILLALLRGKHRTAGHFLNDKEPLRTLTKGRTIYMEVTGNLWVFFPMM